MNEPDFRAIPQQIYEKEIERVEASRKCCTTYNEYREDVFRFYQWYFERGLLRLNRGQVTSFTDELIAFVGVCEEVGVEELGKALALKRLSTYDHLVEDVRDEKNPESLYEADTTGWAKGGHYCARCGARYADLCGIDYWGFRDRGVGECSLEPLSDKL